VPLMIPVPCARPLLPRPDSGANSFAVQEGSLRPLRFDGARYRTTQRSSEELIGPPSPPARIRIYPKPLPGSEE
jgi:hypothetical protein